MNTTTDAVFDINGNRVGTVVREGSEWVAYSTSDLEMYRGMSYTLACDACRDSAVAS